MGNTATATTDLANMLITEDYAVIEVHKEVEVKNADGTVSKNTEITLTTVSGEKKIQEAELANKLRYKQTIGWTEPKTVEGWQAKYPDVDDFCAVMAAGQKSSRIAPRLKKLLEATDSTPEANLTFEPVPGVHNIDKILPGIGRRNLTDDEKAMENLAVLFPHFTKPQLWAFVEQLRASGASMPGVTDTASSNENVSEESEVEATA